MEKDIPKIIHCEIGQNTKPLPKGMFYPIPEVKVRLSNGEELILFTYYPDEITITESELIGRTVDQARRIKFEKDKWSLHV